MGEAANGTDGVNGANGTSSQALCSSAANFLQHSYDYIVIGGGTAGLVLAARLTENPNVHVGVLEAGKNRMNDMMVNIPALFPKMLGDPEYDWKMSTVPQTENRNLVHAVVRGKMLGGSSAINYMMYVRGSSQDYDDWAEFGDSSWSSAEMQKYFRKHQTFEPLDESIKDRSVMPFVEEFHGTDGPIRTSFNSFRVPFEDDFMRTCDEVAGMMKKPRDPWSGDHIGFYSSLGCADRNFLKGTRSYSASGYLAPNLGRPNLKVLTEATASQVLLEGHKATGVRFMHGGQTYTVPARHEVIVSCGVFQSPQILELSGIGDAEILKSAGVECKVALPAVGANLQDHVLTGAVYKLAPGETSVDALHDPDTATQAQEIYGKDATGPLAAMSTCMGFLPYSSLVSPQELEETVESIRKTPSKTPFEEKQREQIIANLKSPISANVQIILIPATGSFTDEAIADESKLFAVPESPSDPHGVTWVIGAQYPVSRGTVHIKSSDPMEHPSIDPAYITHSADIDVLAAGVRFMDKVSKTKFLKDKLAKRLWPPAEMDLQKSVDSVQSTKDMIHTQYHPIGTCAMSQVVDAQLKVKGVQGLRVVDASIFPSHVSGNICSSVYAVAEKAADMIKAESGL